MVNLTPNIHERILGYVDPTRAKNTSIALGFTDFKCVKEMTQFFPLFQKAITTREPTEIVKEKVKPFVIGRLFSHLDQGTIYIYEGVTYNNFRFLFDITQNFICLYLQDKNDKHKNDHFMYTLSLKRPASYFSSYLKFGHARRLDTTQMVYLAKCCIRAVLIDILEILYTNQENAEAGLKQIIPQNKGDETPEFVETQWYYVKIQPYPVNYMGLQDVTKEYETFISSHYLKFKHANTQYIYRMTISFYDNSVSQNISVVNHDELSLDISDHMISCTIDKNKKISYKCLVKKIEAYRNTAISTFQKLLEENSNQEYKTILHKTTDMMVDKFKYNPAETRYHGKTYSLSFGHEQILNQVNKKYYLPSPAQLLKDTFEKLNSDTHVQIFLESYDSEED